MTARCPTCGVLLHCPCPACRAEEPAGALHYLFKSGVFGEPDILWCPVCLFSGPVDKWEMISDATKET